jgi:antirestriction protein ArdC
MAQRNHRNAASRPSIYQTVTDRILSSLKAGVIPWEKPWKSPRFTGGPFPRNFYTGKPYRGINVLLLWSSEYSFPFWLTTLAVIREGAEAQRYTVGRLRAHVPRGAKAGRRRHGNIDAAKASCARTAAGHRRAPPVCAR